MALRGNLKDFSLPDVFQLVTFSRKTGVLRIEREDAARGSVWFRDGDVFFAQSNWHTEPLGERLVRAQRLTSQALARALAMRVEEGEDGRRLGQILIDEGYITDEVLESFVSDQIQETIFDLMRWDEGDFDFEAMPEAVEEDIGLSVSIENVIMEGSRRLEEWARIKKKIPSMDVVFKMATAPGEGTFEISLKPMEWNLLLLVDGTRSVAELAHETDRTDFEVARIVYGLFSAGLLEFATDEEVERLRAERAVRDAQLAAIESERREAQAAAAAAAQAREAALLAEEEARQSALRVEAEALETARLAEEEARRPELVEPPHEDPEPAVPHEVPEFLGSMTTAPSMDDAAVLEEMMGAVLRRPAEPEAEAHPVEPSYEVPVTIEPHIPAEDPAFMGVDQVDTADLPMMPVPSVDDLLHDLAGLRVPRDVAASDAAATAVAAAWAEAPLIEQEPEQPVVPVDSALADLGQALFALGGPPPLPDAPAPVPAIETEPEPESTIDVVSEPEVLPRPLAEFSYETPQPIGYPGTVSAAPQLPETPLPTTDADIDFVAEPASLLPPTGDLGETREAEPEYVAVDEPEVISGYVDSVTIAPAVETDVQFVPVLPTEPAEDFERDLMALGLGELPADLLDSEPQVVSADVDVVAADPTYEWVETPGAPEVTVEAPRVQGDVPDFSELLESLDVDSDPVYVEPEVEAVAPLIDIAPEADFDEELLREVAPAQAGGVISTDAYLDDITIDDMDFSCGLTDELSALTGADRPSRPTANVNKIPDATTGELLHRDARVDKETLLRIIDGIKNL